MCIGIRRTSCFLKAFLGNVFLPRSWIRRSAVSMIYKLEWLCEHLHAQLIVYESKSFYLDSDLLTGFGEEA